MSRLGYGPDDRVLVLSCAELGVFHAGNVAIYEALRDATATTATLHGPGTLGARRCGPVPGRGHRRRSHAQRRARPVPLGTDHPRAVLARRRWRVPRTAADLWDHADLDEVRRECRAQLERAIYWGFDVSHLDAHLDAVALKPEFFDVFLDLAEDFRLPLRLPDARRAAPRRIPVPGARCRRGVVSPDRVIPTGALAHALAGGPGKAEPHYREPTSRSGNPDADSPMPTTPT